MKPAGIRIQLRKLLTLILLLCLPFLRPFLPHPFLLALASLFQSHFRFSLILLSSYLLLSSSVFSSSSSPSESWSDLSHARSRWGPSHLSVVLVGGSDGSSKRPSGSDNESWSDRRMSEESPWLRLSDLWVSLSVEQTSAVVPSSVSYFCSFCLLVREADVHGHMTQTSQPPLRVSINWSVYELWSQS